MSEHRLFGITRVNQEGGWAEGERGEWDRTEGTRGKGGQGGRGEWDKGRGGRA